jgi:Zn-dependent M32 family carboxypeptidase
VADSLLEFEAKGELPPALAAEERTLLDAPGAKAFFIRSGRLSFAAATVSAFLCLVFLASVILLAAPGRDKAEAVSAFLHGNLSQSLPAYYLLGKPLVLDFRADTSVLGELAVEALSNLYSASNGVVTIPEQVTVPPSLRLKVFAKRFGISRTVAETEITGTERLLPAGWKMTVSYPGADGLAGEEYPGPRDIDVWRGAVIELSGEMTRELSNVSLPPLREISRTVNKREFRLRALAADAKVTPVFIAPDGDRFEPPAFNIALRENLPPELKLLFPKTDVRLTVYRWSVTALLEASDDQAVRALLVRETVSNGNPRLSRYTAVRETRIRGQGERLERFSPVYTWREHSLLPGEILSLEFRAADPFGALSAPVSFSILCPGFETLSKMRQEQEARLSNAVREISNRSEGLARDAKEQNLAGYEKRAGEMAAAVSNASDALDRLTGSSDPAGEAAEMKETLEKMKEVTEALRKQSDLLKRMSDSAEKTAPDAEKVDMANLDVKEQLRELTSLLKGLESYRKTADLLAAQQALTETYRELRSREKGDPFDRALESYREGLKKLEELGSDRTKEIARQLSEASKDLRPQDEASFRKSDALMAALSDSVKQDAADSAEDRMKKKAAIARRAAEECYLEILVLRRAVSPRGSEAAADMDTLVETASAVRDSILAVRREVNEALEGTVLETPDGRDPGKILRERMEENGVLLESALSQLRERRSDPAVFALSRLSSGISELAIDLLVLSRSMEHPSGGGSSGGGQKQKQLSMGMDGVMQMQSQVTSGIEDLLKQLASEGKLTPELEKSMRELAELQSEIAKNLREMMGKQEGGLLSGGRDMADKMDDIAKDLAGYRVNSGTLEKSKKLEEKLLQAKKSMKSRGETEERESRSGHDFESVSPDGSGIETPALRDPDSIGGKPLPEYYRKLLERYRAIQKETEDKGQ